MRSRSTTSIWLVFGFFVLMALTPFHHCLAQGANHKETRWGMSMAQVQADENEALLKADLDSGFLGYRGNAFSMDAHIFYLFKNDKLWKVEDLILCDPGNEKDFLSKQKLMNKSLTEKYGAPSQVKEEWKNDRYKNDSTKKSLAIRLGHLELYNMWESKTTFIISGLNGGKDGVILFANYVSKQDPDWVKEKR